MRMSPPIDLCMCHLRGVGGNPFGYVAQEVKGPFLRFQGQLLFGEYWSCAFPKHLCIYIYAWFLEHKNVSYVLKAL